MSWPAVVEGVDGEWLYVRDDLADDQDIAEAAAGEYGRSLDSYSESGVVHLRPVGRGRFIEVRPETARTCAYRRFDI